MQPQIFDTIIIGGGPAGLSAAIYAVRKSLNVLLLTKNIGGQAALSGDIENYLGYSVVSGADLAVKFREEVERFKDKGIWIKEGVDVTDLTGQESRFLVTAGESKFSGKTVIIASGRVPRMLNIPGEKEFLGKGVATCATCDGPLYKGKDVVVVGGGNSALDAAFALLKVASKVTIVNLTEELRGDSVLLKNVTTASNVTILNNHETLAVEGQTFVTGVKVKDKQSFSTNKRSFSTNKNSGEEKVIPASGVFIEIGWMPSTAFDKLTKKDEKGQIIVDEFGKTSVDGIWAAGDVNNLWGEQIIISAGEGAKVALSVSEHIAKIPHAATSNVHMAG